MLGQMMKIKKIIHLAEDEKLKGEKVKEENLKEGKLKEEDNTIKSLL
jgi:hypothetical protein